LLSWRFALQAHATSRSSASLAAFERGHWRPRLPRINWGCKLCPRAVHQSTSRVGTFEGSGPFGLSALAQGQFDEVRVLRFDHHRNLLAGFGLFQDHRVLNGQGEAFGAVARLGNSFRGRNADDSPIALIACSRCGTRGPESPTKRTATTSTCRTPTTRWLPCGFYQGADGRIWASQNFR